MEKRVLLISYHFYPDRAVGAKRPTQLAESFQSKGWVVDTITRSLTPPEEAVRRSEKRYGTVHSLYQHPGVVNPLWRKIKSFRGAFSDNGHAASRNSGANSGDSSDHAAASESLIQKAKRYLFSLQALLDANKSWLILSFLYLIYIRIRGRRYDLVVSSSPPASVHLVGLLAKKFFRCKWIADLRDPLNLWHEVDPGSASPLRERIEAWLEDMYYKNSDALVVTTSPLKEQIGNDIPETASKLHLIYNGYDGERIKEKKKLNRDIRFIFAGSLYMNRDPFPLFLAIKELSKESNNNKYNVRLDLYGDCRYWNGYDLDDWVIKNGLEKSISLHRFVDPKQLERVLSDADVLVNFAQNQPLQIPAKTFEYLRYPAISLAITETGSAIFRLMSDHNLGISSDNTEEGLLHGIRLVMEKMNEEIRDGDSIEMFSRCYQNHKYIELAKTLIANPKDCSCGN